MSAAQHLLFIAAVAVAGYVQNLTGFAFGLVLLGTVGLLQLAPVADATIAVSVVALANAAQMGRRGMSHLHAPTLLPTLAGSLVGVVAGVMLLGWLSDRWTAALRPLLGLTIVGCAVLLMARSQPLPRPSGRPAFAVAGLLSGVLGGLFATGGPPLVYHYYRQPLELDRIRSALVAVFAASGVVRLGVLGSQDRITAQAVLLSLEAVPVVLLLGWAARRWPPPNSVKAVRGWVALLLTLTGAGLFVPEALALLRRLALG